MSILISFRTALYKLIGGKIAIFMKFLSNLNYYLPFYCSSLLLHLFVFCFFSFGFCKLIAKYISTPCWHYKLNSFHYIFQIVLYVSTSPSPESKRNSNLLQIQPVPVFYRPCPILSPPTPLSLASYKLWTSLGRTITHFCILVSLAPN